MTDLVLDLHRVGDTLRLAVAGDVDLASAGDLAATIRDAVDRAGPADVLVDLARVPFLDSTGIRTLVHAHRYAAERRVALRVTNPRPIVARVLAVTGVLGVLTGDQSALIAAARRTR